MGVDGWPQTAFSPPADAKTTITATDWFGYLANVELPRSVYEIEVAADSPAIWYPFGEPVGQTAHDVSGNGVDATYAYGPAARSAQSIVAGDSGGALTIGDANLPGTSGGVPAAVSRLSGNGFPTGYPITLECWLLPHISSQVMDPNPGSVMVIGVGIDGGAFATLEVLYDSTLGKFALAANSGTATDSARAATPGVVPWSAGSPTLTLADRPHHIVAVFTSTSAKIRMDGVDLAVTTDLTGANPAVGTFLTLLGQDPVASWPQFPVTIDEVAIYTTALSDARIDAHYRAGSAPWSGDKTGARIDRILALCGVGAFDNDVDPGVTVLGPTALATDALSYLKSIEATEDGQLYVASGGVLKFRDRNQLALDPRRNYPQAAFTDAPASTAAVWDVSLWDTGTWAGPPAIRFEPDGLRFELSDQHVYNDVSVTWDAGTETWSDATSIATYGRRSRSISTRLATAGEAKLRAISEVERFKDAKIQVSGLSVNLAALNDDTQTMTVLGLRIGDRVAVRFHPQSVGAPIELEAFIEGISDDISDGANVWQRTFNLSLAI